MKPMDVRTNLAQLRTKRGIAAARLAAEVGINRKTIYAIEAGTYVPNTIVSLKLARVLDTTVEELFKFEVEPKTTDATAEVFILGETGSLPTGHLHRWPTLWMGITIPLPLSRPMGK
jgi:DNA-binding XRE family transcriptional regulator